MGFIFGITFEWVLEKHHMNKANVILVFLAVSLLSSCTVEVVDDYGYCDTIYREREILYSELDLINADYLDGYIDDQTYDYSFGFVEGQIYQLELDFPECFGLSY